MLVDTSIWSQVLRRIRRPTDASAAVEILELVEEGRLAVIGPIRQELLSGIRDEKQFELLRSRLEAFPDEELQSEDYVRAAAFWNLCRAKGIQGSAIDFLICSAAVRHGLSIYTADADFTHFARVLPIVLHAPGE